MHILHALWRPFKGLALWIESSDHYDNVKSSGKNHPFVLNHEEVCAVLKEYTNTSHSLTEKEVLLSLPTDEYNLPIPSFKDKVRTGTFSQWKIPIFTVQAEDIYDFMLALENRSNDFSLGSSVLFWQSAAFLALEIVLKGAYIPSLRFEEDNDLYKAFWKPLLGDYAEKLANRAKLMPPLCQAEVLKKYSSADLIENFLEQTIDVFVKKNSPILETLTTQTLPKDDIEKAAHRWLLQFCPSGKERLTSNLKESQKSTDIFAGQVDNWVHDVEKSAIKAEAGKKPLKTTFTIDQATPTSDTWKFSFFMEAGDNSDLKIQAGDIGKDNNLLKDYESPERKSLMDLALAEKTFPKIRSLLEQQHPVQLELTTAEAYDFLKNHAEPLSENFGVQVPSWWHKPRKGLGSHVQLKKRTNQISASSLLEYDWKVSLGDQVLTEEEFHKLTEQKTPLVNIKGEWFEIDPQEVSTTLKFLKSGVRKELSLIDAIKMTLGKEDPNSGMKVDSVQAEDWFNKIIGTLQNPEEITTITAPQSFMGTLRPYQERGLSWLSFLQSNNFGACLADDMGLGKTIQVIALILHEKKTSSLKVPHLLICPMSILGNWQKELKRFAPRVSVMVHHGPGRLSKEKFRKEAFKHDIVMTTYALCSRDWEELESITWKSIILDEAQNIKNSTTRQTQVIKSLDSYYKIALTGTPIENRLSEL